MRYWKKLEEEKPSTRGMHICRVNNTVSTLFLTGNLAMGIDGEYYEASEIEWLDINSMKDALDLVEKVISDGKTQYEISFSGVDEQMHSFPVSYSFQEEESAEEFYNLLIRLSKDKETHHHIVLLEEFDEIPQREESHLKWIEMSVNIVAIDFDYPIAMGKSHTVTTLIKEHREW
jgi:hypothetical protein